MHLYSSIDLLAREIGHGFGFDDFAVSILAAGGDAEGHGAGVFLVFGHEQILDLRPAPEREDEQAGGARIERAAVADLLGVEAAADDGDHVMRGHAGRFIYEEDTVKAGQIHGQWLAKLFPARRRANRSCARPRRACGRRRRTARRLCSRRSWATSSAG